MSVKDTYSKMFQRYRGRPAWYVSSKNYGKISQRPQNIPKIIITHHAINRLWSRMNAQKQHMASIAVRAWVNEEPIPWPFKKVKMNDGRWHERDYGKTYVYRKYKKFIFVFSPSGFIQGRSVMTLITIRGPYEEEKNNNQ